MYFYRLIIRGGDSMKKQLYLLTCIGVSLSLLVGCSTYGKDISEVDAERVLTENPTGQSVVTPDWETTPYEKINNFDGVSMTVDEETVSNTGLTVVFENNSSNQSIYGEYFSLENKINGQWHQVPVIVDSDYGFNDIGYNLDSGDSRDLKVDWDWLYGSLDAGEYRIVKDVLDISSTEDYHKYYLVAEFTIY